MNKLKIGVIGLGVGEKHAEAYMSHPSCEVVALCDLMKRMTRTVGARYRNAYLTDDAERILRDRNIDIVSIASYDDCHYDQIMSALKNDKHVFVEKPICIYREEAIKIRKLLAKKPRLKISSNLILRKSPRFRLLKKMISDNRFGDLYYIEGDYNYGRINKITEGWRSKLPFYSVVYGGGVHIVDLILWMTKDRVCEVKGYGNRIATRSSSFKYDDFNVSILKFKSGMIAKIASNFGCVSPHFHNLTLYGTKATFINDFKHGKLIKSRERKDGEFKITESYNYGDKGALISNFVDSIIRKDVLPEVSIEDIFNAMSVCFAMEKASHTDDAVSVEYL